MSDNLIALIEGTIGEAKADSSIAACAEAREIARNSVLLEEAKVAARNIISGMKILKERAGSKFWFQVREQVTGICIATNIDYPVGPHGGKSVVSIHVGGDDRWSQQTIRVYGRGEMHIDGAKDPEASNKVVAQIARMAVNWGLVS